MSQKKDGSEDKPFNARLAGQLYSHRRAAAAWAALAGTAVLGTAALKRHHSKETTLEAETGVLED